MDFAEARACSSLASICCKTAFGEVQEPSRRMLKARFSSFTSKADRIQAKAGMMPIYATICSFMAGSPQTFQTSTGKAVSLMKLKLKSQQRNVMLSQTKSASQCQNFHQRQRRWSFKLSKKLHESMQALARPHLVPRCKSSGALALEQLERHHANAPKYELEARLPT